VRHPATLVFILALQALPAIGAEKGSPITKATVTLIANSLALNKICNSKENIFACTAFRDEFSCSCEQMQQRWQLDVSVRVTPSIYLWKPEYLGHERDHIGDIRVAVLRYVHELEERRFVSLEECSGVARSETEGFDHLMDTFKEDSNAKRHPFYRRRVPTVPVPRQ
jgi:hypothetical protein